jgi:hypothetical protein
LIQTAGNTVVFDHYHLQPRQSDPLVLRLADGDYFQVRIVNTDTTQFNYRISAVPDEETPTTSTGATGSGVAATRLGETTVTMRHGEAFARYRVTIALRADLAQAAAPPPGGRQAGGVSERTMLFPAVFDVWVQTKPGFEVSFTGGVTFSGLTSPKFFIKTDDRGTPDTADDVKTVEEDRDASDKFRPDTVAMANFRHPEKLAGIGIAVGVGLNNEADPRFFVGPSYFLGRNLLLTGGWSGGRVDRLPNGQELGETPINGDNTLTTLDTRFQHAFFVGLAFSFIPKAEDNFKGAFAAAQKTAAPAAASEAAGSSAPPPQPAVTPEPGEYKARDGRVATVGKLAGDQLPITLPGEQETNFTVKGAVSSVTVKDVTTSCSFSRPASAAGPVLTITCTRADKEIFRGEQVR